MKLILIRLNRSSNNLYLIKTVIDQDATNAHFLHESVIMPILWSTRLGRLEDKTSVLYKNNSPSIQQIPNSRSIK